jgi:hypothetical protein
VSIVIPDEFSEEQEKQFVKIFETVSEMKVTRPIRRSAAALVAARQNGALEEQEIQKGSKNVLVVRIGGLSTTGTILGLLFSNSGKNSQFVVHLDFAKIGFSRSEVSRQNI